MTAILSSIPPPELEHLLQDGLESSGVIRDNVKEAIQEAIKTRGKPDSDGCYDDLLAKWFPIDSDSGEDAQNRVKAKREKFKDKIEQCIAAYWKNIVEESIAEDLLAPMEMELERAIEHSGGSPASLADTIWDWIRERQK